MFSGTTPSAHDAGLAVIAAAVTVPVDVPGVSRTGMPIEFVSPVRT
jgi:hypothetical protein